MKKFIFLKIEAFLILISLFTSCEKEKTSAEIIEDPKLLSNLYSDSVDTLVIGTNKYFLETYLSRDFMPNTSKNPKHPLTASITLISYDTLPIPNALQIDKLYVVYNQLIWVSNPIDNKQTYFPYQLHRVSTNGPEWGPNLDVIVKFIDTSNQKEYFMITKNQEVLIAWK
jgi:hypothetical protein